MQRFSIVLLAAVMCLSAMARAEMVKMDGVIALSVTGEDWALRLPAEDWSLAQEQAKPDGTGVFYYLVSNNRSLNFSVFLDKTDACNSAESCRDHFWKSPHPDYKAAKDITHFTRNGFAVTTFRIERIMNMPATQTNVSAHAYRDGDWIDVGLSKVGGTTPPVAPLLEFLDTLRIQ